MSNNASWIIEVGSSYAEYELHINDWHVSLMYCLWCVSLPFIVNECKYNLISGWVLCTELWGTELKLNLNDDIMLFYKLIRIELYGVCNINNCRRQLKQEAGCWSLASTILKPSKLLFQVSRVTVDIVLE